jgi:hypothetical protein
MTQPRPLQCYYSQADLICPDGLFKQQNPIKLVLLHNGGSCNACTMKRCITFRCISKHTTLLNVTIT